MYSISTVVTFSRTHYKDYKIYVNFSFVHRLSSNPTHLSKADPQGTNNNYVMIPIQRIGVC